MENNLAKYIAFIKTAETGSFTRAAENLNYAQSTVSKIIAVNAAANNKAERTEKTFP